MVRHRTRRLRHRRRPTDPPRSGFSAPTLKHNVKVFLASPLLLVTLYLTLVKPEGIARAWQPQQSQQAFHSPSWVPKLAQASVPIPLTRQGLQVTLNGRPLSAAWSQRQQRIGIADSGLMRIAGADLLDSDTPAQQPIAWFTADGEPPLTLSTWLTNQYRYLDVSELSRRYGWQMQINGAALQIATPPSQITGVRQGKQSWGDRIVVELAQPAPWQLEEERGAFTVTIDAQLAPALLSSFKGQQGNRISAMSLQSAGNRTVIRVQTSTNLRPRVWSLANPNRLLIDVRPDSLVERNILWAPGVRWKQQRVRTGVGDFPIAALEVDLRQPGVSVKPILGGGSTVVGSASLLKMAQQWQAAGAINAGFFNRNTRLPLGAIRKDQRWVSGPILNRGVIGWNDSGEIQVGHLDLQETLITSSGQRLPVMHLNSGYVGEGLSRYSSDWGSTYTPVLNNEVLITVQNNQVVSQRRAGAAGQGAVPIPPEGYVLVARSDAAAANALGVGTAVQIETSVQPAAFDRYAQIMGAGPLLVQNQRIVLNAQAEQFSKAFIQQAAPRSVVATTPDGKLLLLAIHNRLDGLGPTLAETAQIVQQMGVKDALNLDGGSSTSLYLGGQLLDRPPSTAARVNNGIGIFIQAGF